MPLVIKTWKKHTERQLLVKSITIKRNQTQFCFKKNHKLCFAHLAEKTKFAAPSLVPTWTIEAKLLPIANIIIPTINKKYESENCCACKASTRYPQCG